MEIDYLSKMRNRLNDVSPSFCLAKWYQTTLHLFNGNTQSCHHVKSHRVPLSEIAGDPGALHNSSFKKSVRAQMLKGKFPKECQYCWNIEKVGEYSDRIHKSASAWAAPYLPAAAKSHPDKGVYPTSLEVAFSNVCNFKCMYCSPSYSSLWHKEIKEHGPYPTSRLYNNLQIMKLNQVDPLEGENREKYVQAFWRWWPEVAPHLHHLRVTGGEPFLSPDTWALMESLIREPRPHLIFSINTNMSMSDATMNRLLQKIPLLAGKVAKFTLFLSIDSVGSQAEYIRHGLNFERFVQNAYRLLGETPTPIRVSYMITVNALCLPGLSPLIKLIARQRREFPQHEIGFDTPYLRHPEHLSLFILPRSFQNYLEGVLNEMRQGGFISEEVQKIERILALMKSRPYGFVKRVIMRRDLLAMLREHDRRRKTDFRKTFPEYDRFFMSWL